MKGTKQLLIINIVGLLLLFLVPVWLLTSLSNEDINPVTIIGFAFSVFALGYLTALLIWSLLVFRAAVKRKNYTKAHWVQAIIIFIVGIVFPGLFILFDLYIVSRH